MGGMMSDFTSTGGMISDFTSTGGMFSILFRIAKTRPNVGPFHT